MTKFTDEVEIDAPTQVGLVVTGPVAGAGAGAQLTTTGTGGRGWEILATGQASAQGKDKLNIRDLGNGEDVFTITSDGKVGIGTTTPFAALTVNAPDWGGLSVSGPAPGIGAALSLTPAGHPSVPVGGGAVPLFLPSWQILATGQTALQGSGKLNFSCVVEGLPGRPNSIDAFTITSTSKVGIGTTNPGFTLEIDAPDQSGLRIAGPKTGVGAGITLSATDAGTNVNSWEVLATGDTAAQGPGRLNIRDLITSEDVLTIERNKVGIGTTNPGFKLEIDAPDQLGLHIAGPKAGVGAAISLSATDAGTNVNSWEILATGDTAAQGPGKLNIRNLITGKDVLAIDVNGTLNVSGDIVMPASDFAEDFAVDGSDAIEPGTVVVLDGNGVLRASDESYDKKVAGVVSGAGDYRPGIILDRHTVSPGRLPVALVGKVYCKVDTAFGAIEVGDLLTTSPTPGHAMKATDQLKAFGSVIGKAMRPLESGRGLIPILIALQ